MPAKPVVESTSKDEAATRKLVTTRRQLERQQRSAPMARERGRRHCAAALAQLAPEFGRQLASAPVRRAIHGRVPRKNIGRIVDSRIDDPNCPGAFKPLGPWRAG